MVGTIEYCTYNSGFSELIVIALLTVTFMAALAYMAAQFARRPEWEAWSKVQLYHVCISALLAAGALWFAGLACGIAVSLAGGDPFTIAQEHLGRLMMGNMRTAISQMITAQVEAEGLAAVYIQLGGAQFGTGFSPFPVYRVISGNLQLLSGLAVPFTSSLFAQQVGLQVVQASAFTILLPVGILLRAFTITRDAGSFMIAASIGLFIVLPLCYVMDKMIMAGPYTGDPGSQSPVGPVAPPSPPSAQDTKMCIDASTGYDRSADAGWYLIYPDSVTLFMSRLPFAPQNMIASALSCMSYVIPQAVFLPTLNIIIVIAFINALTKFLVRSFG